MIVILKNDFYASYLTYKDEYWTLYYYKPYCRIYGYLIGVWFGCEYFSFKHNDAGYNSAIVQLYTNMKEKNSTMLRSMIGGFMTTFLMIWFHNWINNNPYDISFGWSLLFLLFGRPLFIVGVSFIFSNRLLYLTSSYYRILPACSD